MSSTTERNIAAEVFLQTPEQNEVPPFFSDPLAVVPGDNSPQTTPMEIREDDASSTTPTSSWMSQCFPTRKNQQWGHVWYISSGAILGSALRVYIGRLMGGDCENMAAIDFLSPFFRRICITVGGRTQQTGGALFRDLPVNMLGSLFMGILTAKKTTPPHAAPLPWLHKDHPLQKHTSLHTGLGVGVCGCLTTFASWNSQMILMMDGSYTVLGPQIGPALFGYLLGMMTAVASFRMGRLVAWWMYSRSNPGSKHPDDDDRDDHEVDAEQQELPTVRPREFSRWSVHHIQLLHAMAFLMVILTIVGFWVYDNLFYQEFFLALVVAPFGALSRWKLSKWNSTPWMGHSQPLSWIPWGTFLANMLGCLVSIICTGLLDRYQSTLEDDWSRSLIGAIRVGFAGSLSTVSTFVKEIVVLQEKMPGSAKPSIYGALTCGGGMIIGVIAYAVIVRIGQ